MHISYSTENNERLPLLVIHSLITHNNGTLFDQQSKIKHEQQISQKEKQKYETSTLIFKFNKIKEHQKRITETDNPHKKIDSFFTIQEILKRTKVKKNLPKKTRKKFLNNKKKYRNI